MRRPALIVCLIAIAALAAGIAALYLWPEPEAGLPEPQPSPPPAAELIREQSIDVLAVYFSPFEGEPYTLRRDPGSGDIELEAPGMIFPGNGVTIRQTFNTAVSLTGLTRVTEEADRDRLELFGLTDPVMEWRVYRTDGTAVDLMVGAQQAAGRGRYARVQGSGEVFLLSETQSWRLTQPLEDMYDLSFFPLQPPGETENAWDAITRILLETASGDIELRRRTNQELTGAPMGTSQFQLLQPFIGDCNDYLVHTIFLEQIADITPGRIEEKHPPDLSVYGLDAPYRLTVSADEWTGTLLVGRRDAERGGRFIMIEGYDAVLFDGGSDYSFLQADPTHLRSPNIWLHNINTVSSVTYNLEGVTRTLTLEHDPGDDSLEGWLDGGELSETNARRLYMATLRIGQNGGTDAQTPDNPPEYSVTMQFSEGGEETLELYRLNDSEFLIVHNGLNTGLFITRMTLHQNFLSRFEILDRGEDIPRL
jgi:hypothetical protein